MPNLSRPTLMWSQFNQLYELHLCGQVERHFSEQEGEAFSAWLRSQISFAFVGQSGRLSVLKEARTRGNGYWYAYRKQGHHTHKGYLGPSPRVTFARLEELASSLAPAPHSSPLACAPSRPIPEYMTPLLSTKLVPPRLPGFLVARPRLLRDLDLAWTLPLTLVSSSAGSGKTTLLSAWASQQEDLVAWLSLDSLDADPTRFWTACIVALRRCLPTLGEEALSLLRAPQSPPLLTILMMVLNEMARREQKVTLILDDFQVISHQAISASLLFLLEHLPANMHLIFATRTDPELPLSRFRVWGQLLELRFSDLRFTQEETAHFLVHRMNLPLSEAEVAMFENRTEGWIAGLQLAALSLAHQPNPSHAASDFGGSHRYLLDYVQQDILARLSGPLRDFLLQTSVVGRMNAALCQAVMVDSTRQVCQHILEEIERANLFVVPLDTQRQWYRYHDLFREALQARLQASQPELVPLLHVRAARWYETQGEFREAIVHALFAADYAYAAALMLQAAPSFWLQGEVRTVHSWTLSLPDPVLRTHLRLVLSASLRFIDAVNLSTSALHNDMITQVEQTFSQLDGLLREKQRWAFSQTEQAWIERRFSMLRAWIELSAMNSRGDVERLRQVVTELETFPLDEEMSWNMIPLSFALWLFIPHLGRSAALIPKFRKAAQMMMEARDYQMTIRLKAMLAFALTLDAQFEQARQQCLEGIALLKTIQGRAPWEGYLYYSLFIVSYVRNQLVEASDWLQRMLQVAQVWQQIELLVRGQIYAVRLALAQGDLSQAEQTLHTLEELVQREGYAFHVPLLNAARIQVWLAQGNLEEARSWAAHIPLREDPWNPLRRWEALMLIRVLLAQQQNVLAVEMLECFHPYFEPPGDRQTEIEWMALSVVALSRSGKQAQALQVAARLLAIAEPEGFVRLDLDTGEPLMKEVLEMWLQAPLQEVLQTEAASLSRSAVLHMLALLDEKGPRLTRESGLTILPFQHAVQHEQVEALSRREQQVLPLLVAGQTYAEMAQELIVSPHTIKTHVSSIYRKLGVSRRAEAIAAASRLRLL